MTALRIAALTLAGAWAVGLMAVAGALVAAANADLDQQRQYSPDEHSWELVGDELAHDTECWCGQYAPRPPRKPVGT